MTNPTPRKKSSTISHELIRQEAIELFQQGMKIPAIATTLGISRLTLLRHLMPEEIIAKRIEALLKEGLGYYPIGDILGIDGVTIVKRAKKAGLDEVNTEKVVVMFQAGTPINQIAQKLQMNIQNVIKKIPQSLRREQLRKLYQEDQLPYDQIIARLGISRTSLKNWLRRYNLMNRHPNAGKEFKKYPKQKIIGDYLQLNSIQSIIERRKFPGTTIKRILDEAGVRRSSSLGIIRNHINGAHDIEINRTLREVVTGELLGDANIRPNRSSTLREITIEEYRQAIKTLQMFQQRHPPNVIKWIPSFNEALRSIQHFRTARFNLNMSILAAPWGYHIQRLFTSNRVPLSLRIVDTAHTTVEYSGLSLWSNQSIQFTELYNQWYPNGTKVVPRNIQITPAILLHWFIGDGFKMRPSIGFCTHNFSITDVEFLVELLNETLGIRSHWRYNKSSRSKDQPILIISRQNDIKKFYKYLEQGHLESLAFAKRFFRWKFKNKIRKRDVMRSEWHLRLLRKNLQANERVFEMVKKTIQKYYFKKKT